MRIYLLRYDPRNGDHCDYAVMAPDKDAALSFAKTYMDAPYPEGEETLPEDWEMLKFIDAPTTFPAIVAIKNFSHEGRETLVEILPEG